MMLSGIPSKRTPLPVDSIVTFPARKESYRITGVLSEGGFSIAYLAVRTSGGGPLVVLKEYFPAFAEGSPVRRENGKILPFPLFPSGDGKSGAERAEALADLKRETALANSAARVFISGSENAFRSTDYLSVQGPVEDLHGNLYLLYETYKGINLEQLIRSGWLSPTDIGKKRNGNLPLLLSLLGDVAAKLHLLHQQSILHLDISPSNIFLAENSGGTRLLPFLIDFGSAMDCTREEEVLHHRYTVNQHYSAPELFPLAEFCDPDCGYSATAASDTYSLCAILFYALTGHYADACLNTGEWTTLIRRFFPAVPYGTLGEEFIALLQKGLSPWPSRRFQSSAALYEGLRALETQLQNAPGLLSKLDWEVREAFYTLNRFPLYRYRCEDGALRVLFWGCRTLTDSMVRTVFSCGQMLDAPLEIAVVGEGAEAFRAELLRTAPDLPRFSNLSEDPEDCYAAFVFDEETNTAEEIAARYPDFCAYCMVSLGKTQENQAAAEELLEAYQAVRRSPGVIHVVVTDPIRRDSPLNLYEAGVTSPSPLSFCGTGYPSAFDLQLEANALAVHLSYAGGSPQFSADAERRAFAASEYMERSSAAAALHIPYKLRCLGLPENAGPEALQELRQDAEKMSALLCLEHRRWTAHLIMEGFTRPTDSEILGYAFQGGNKFHLEQGEKKLHPCLVPSRTGLVLRREDFDSPQPERDGLDELDLVSLRLHRLAGVLAARQEPIARGYLALLRQLNGGRSFQSLCDRLAGELEDLFSGRRASLDLSPYETAFAALGIDAGHELQGIRLYTRSVVEYHQYKDYKSLDVSVINVIAHLMEA